MGVSDETKIKGFNTLDTIPDLKPGTNIFFSVSEVQAAAVVRPLKAVNAVATVPGYGPLLVDICLRTFPDLELHTIRVDSIRDVQAHSAVIGSDGVACGAVCDVPEGLLIG